MLGEDEHETDTKNRTSTNSPSELTNPLKLVKKPIQAFESPNSDDELGVRPKLRIWAQISSKQTRKIGLQ